MAFKELCLAIVVLSVISFVIGTVEANNDSSQNDTISSLDDSGNGVKEAVSVNIP